MGYKEITKKIKVCDNCDRELTGSVSYVCNVCDKKVGSCCLEVGGIFSHYYHKHAEVCKSCYAYLPVATICEKFNDKFKKLVRQEAVELSKLKKDATSNKETKDD